MHFPFLPEPILTKNTYLISPGMNQFLKPEQVNYKKMYPLFVFPNRVLGNLFLTNNALLIPSKYAGQIFTKNSTLKSPAVNQFLEPDIYRTYVVKYRGIMFLTDLKLIANNVSN